MGKHVAIYLRVSSKQQSTKSQEPDLEAWAKSQTEPVVLYTDKVTGKKMDRPGWNRLEKDMKAGLISKIVIWRMDRLGRTVSGLSRLFETLQERQVGLLSLRESFDLATPSGRLIAHVLASVAAYETELRGERVRAGQAVAKANGKRWGGCKRGTRKATKEQVKAIHHLRQENTPIRKIARSVGLSAPTIYRVLSETPWSTECPNYHDK